MVWHDESSGKPRLTVYDIPSGARSYIMQNVDKYSFPKIYGNIIVWSADHLTSYPNVYMCDISSFKQTKIAEGYSPDVYDTKIAYTSFDSFYPSQVNVYDIKTNETILETSRLTDPRIYGNKVIGANDLNLEGFIQMYDIVTKESTDVTSDAPWVSDTGFHYDMYGDKIIYAKIGNDDSSNAGIFVYNISSGQSIQLINYPTGTYTTPEIYDNTVVWGVSRNGWSGNFIDDIYVCNLTAPLSTQPPIASFTSDVYIFATKWGCLVSEDGQFYCPWDIAVDSSGNVYVVEQYNDRIQKFDSSGNSELNGNYLGTKIFSIPMQCLLP
jgi:hypothetical protein